MLKHYALVIVRSLKRNFTFSVINLGGLALSMAASMLLMLWIRNEVSYNTFFSQSDRIMQVWSHNYYSDRVESRASIAPPTADKLKSLPFVEDLTLWSGREDRLLATGNANLTITGYFVDQRFLHIMDFELLKGSRDNVLNNPFSIVLTESAAKNLFGNDDPMGKTVRFNNTTGVTVTGILKDTPLNSSIRFGFLMPLSLFVMTTPWAKDCLTDDDCDWMRHMVLLKPGYDVEKVNPIVNEVTRIQRTDYRVENFLYPYLRWHLHGEFENGVERGDDRGSIVTTMGWLAGGILLIACINFMNLSTARSERRAREVGIRKVAGSRRRQLIVQFLSESFVITIAAFFISLLIMELVLPLYRLQTGSDLHVPYASPVFWLMSFAMITISGLMAGCYPAFLLSSLKPALVLKGTVRIGSGSAFLRRLLVGFQFGFSLVLIVISIVILMQANFGLNRQLGFQKENLITIRDNEQVSRNYDELKEYLTQAGAITGMVKTNSPITDVYEVNYLRWAKSDGAPITCANIITGYGYCETMQIKLVEGRDFLQSMKSDTAAMILNQAAVEQLGIDNPVGETVLIGEDRFHVIGVMENVVMTDPFEPVDPLYMILEHRWSDLANTANITIRLTDLSKISDVTTGYKKFAPDYPFEYSFADQDHQEKFNQISYAAALTGTFTFLAILIAALGLFGLAAFVAERRTKEFGIRKVLGATTAQLITLISSGFIRLVVVSSLFSAPIAWWIASLYLEKYTYRIEVSWWLLPVCIMMLVGLTVAITGGQAWKASNINPADSIRVE